MSNNRMKAAGLVLLVVLVTVGAYLIGSNGAYNLRHEAAREEAAAERAFREGDDKRALALYSKLAKEGNIIAAYRLGDMYQYGIGTKADAAQAIKWLTAAAEAGNMDAARQLGLLYLDGDLTVQDFAEARKWLTTAAKTGDFVAARNLADMDYHGLGARADPVSAYAWYEVATVRGSGYGLLMRNKIQGQLTPDQQKEGQDLAARILSDISAIPSGAKVAHDGGSAGETDTVDKYRAGGATQGGE